MLEDLAFSVARPRLPDAGGPVLIKGPSDTRKGPRRPGPRPSSLTRAEPEPVCDPPWPSAPTDGPDASAGGAASRTKSLTAPWSVSVPKPPAAGAEALGNARVDRSIRTPRESRTGRLQELPAEQTCPRPTSRELRSARQDACLTSLPPAGGMTSKVLAASEQITPSLRPSVEAQVQTEPGGAKAAEDAESRHAMETSAQQESQRLRQMVDELQRQVQQLQRQLLQQQTQSSKCQFCEEQRCQLDAMHKEAGVRSREQRRMQETVQTLRDELEQEKSLAEQYKEQMAAMEVQLQDAVQKQLKAEDERTLLEFRLRSAEGVQGGFMGRPSSRAHNTHSRSCTPCLTAPGGPGSGPGAGHVMKAWGEVERGAANRTPDTAARHAEDASTVSPEGDLDLDVPLTSVAKNSDRDVDSWARPTGALAANRRLAAAMEEDSAEEEDDGDDASSSDGEEPLVYHPPKGANRYALNVS
eukprot:TRINITY_DN28436_c0_g1_i1.p1 TRINITY_DN28436_c0_g1~~TRINITY_DN28436_c0_g1_i1.p1  ORF type:complete len:470 (-),score=69.88 TRINITY_DN28436_c0_g1_i1:205-1614(-)